MKDKDFSEAMRRDREYDRGEMRSPTRRFADELRYQTEYAPQYHKQYERERKYQSRKYGKRGSGKR